MRASPRGGLVSELNYRGDLLFLDAAEAQARDRNLSTFDGWNDFLHGWTRVIAEVFTVMMQPGDVAVAISNTGQTASLLEVIRTAREMGATVIGISGRAGRMSRLCSLLLVVEMLENTDIYTPMISRLAALVLIGILAVGVAMRRGGEHQARIAGMKRRLSAMRSRHARVLAGEDP